MTIKQLADIKNSLPKGYRSTLSQETGYSQTTIDHVLSGRRINQSILSAAINLLEQHILSIKNDSVRVKHLLTQIPQ